MATRSNIVLSEGATHVHIYRHWDGYPAETGADLIQKCQGRSLQAALLSLLSVDDGADRCFYEITNDYHGDIEHAYHVRWDGRDEPRIRHAARPMDFPPLGTWVHGGRWITLASFAQVVNAERREVNARCADIGYEPAYPSMLAVAGPARAEVTL